MIAPFVVTVALGLSAQVDTGLGGFGVGRGGTQLPSNLITGTCATVNGVAEWPTSSTLACAAGFTWDGTTLVLPPTWSIPSDATVALGGGVNGLNFGSNTLSLDGTNKRLGIGTNAPGKAIDVEKSAAASDVAIRTTNTSSTGWSSVLVSGTNGGLLGMTAYGGSASAGSIWSGALTPIYNGAGIVNGDANLTSLSLMTGANTSALYLGTNNTVGVVIDASRQDMIQLARYVSQGSAPTDGGGSCTGETIAGNSTSTSGHVSATCTIGQTIILTLVDTFANAPNCFLTCTDADCVTDAFYVSAQATNSVTLTAAVGSAVTADLNFRCEESR